MDQIGYDVAFTAIVSAPDMDSADLLLDREGQRRDIRRIASTLFCSNEIDPSIVTFAKHRTALHWGLNEDDVDVMVTARLLEKAASLMADQRLSRTGSSPAVSSHAVS